MDFLDVPSSSAVQSVQRAMDLLSLVARIPDRGARLNDLVDETGLTKPTVHRLLKQLVQSGMLMQGGNRLYGLGPRAFELGVAAFRRFPLRDLAGPILDDLTASTGDSAFLVVRSGSDSLCITRRLGSYPVKVLTIDTGHRQPMGVGAGGLAMLSFLEEGDRARCLGEIEGKFAQRAYGELNMPVLSRLVRETQERGWARVSDFAVPGVTGVGVPLLNSNGTVFGAITSGAITMRMDDRHVAETVSQLRNAARRLTVALAQSE